LYGTATTHGNKPGISDLGENDLSVHFVSSPAASSPRPDSGALPASPVSVVLPCRHPTTSSLLRPQLSIIISSWHRISTKVIFKRVLPILSA
jgi:hypothetical protein